MPNPRNNIASVHLTPGDLLLLESTLPEQVYKRSPAQHLVSRIIEEARPQVLKEPPRSRAEEVAR